MNDLPKLKVGDKVLDPTDGQILEIEKVDGGVLHVYEFRAGGNERAEDIRWTVPLNVFVYSQHPWCIYVDKASNIKSLYDKLTSG